MNILLLMSGPGEVFREAGYTFPKNLIEIAGLPLAQRVIEGFGPLHESGNQAIFVVQKEENRRFHSGDVIKLLVPSARVIEVTGPTAGAACSALLAIEYVNDDEPLVIVNGDQVLDADLSAILQGFEDRELDGGIVVFRAVHPRWSYVRCNEAGLVVETAEKRPISNLATTGVYYFRRGRDFVTAASDMIRKDASVDGAFYVCPAYNELVLRRAKIGIAEVAREQYHSLANPKGVEAYEHHLLKGS